MDLHELKTAAFQAAKNDNVSIEDGMRLRSPQEHLFYLEMLYYYKLFDLGKIELKGAQKIEQRILSDFKKLENDLRLCQLDYERIIKRSIESSVERTKLTKQIIAGDREFIHTLLHLLDIYSGEGIYNQLYQIMGPELTDPELDTMMDACPEEYRRGKTKDEIRSTVWHVISQLSEGLSEGDQKQSAKIPNV